MMGGMMSPAMIAGIVPDLTDDQRAKIAKIHEDKPRQALGHDEEDARRAVQAAELYYADQPDADAIRVSTEAGEMRQQMVDASLSRTSS
jgi:Spy/CpxP family protein refolding chaperone